jgi:His-Xaa-Ser system protein HxsD
MLETDTHINIDSAHYSPEAVRAACVDLWKHAETQLEHVGSQVKITFHNSKLPASQLHSKFRQLILDHQTRLDLEKKTGTIRELIVTQAFAPCDNLQEVLDRIRNEETKR